MNTIIYSLPPLITALLILNVILFLIYMESEERGRLLPLCFATLWWHIGEMFLLQSQTYEMAAFLSKTVHVGILYVPVGIVWMFKPYFRFKYLLPFAHTCYAFMLALLLFSDTMIAGVHKYDFGYFPLAGSLHPIFVVSIAASVGSSIVAAYLARKRVDSALERKHLTLLAFLGLIYSVAAVDFLQNYGLATFYPIGFIFVTIFLISSVYSILKFSLLQSRNITSKQIAQTVANTAQMVAHDIQAPFNMLQVTLDQLKAKSLNENSLDQHISRIEHSKAYVMEVLQDLLVFGSERLNRLAELDLGKAFLECWSRLESLHNNEISADTSGLEALTVTADQAKIKRLFSNLLLNAIEAIKGAGVSQAKVWLNSRHTKIDGKQFIEITLGNSGTFISKEDLKGMFVKFNSKGKAHGSGLGLMVVQEVVHSHGGEIRCQSARKLGTEFVFTIPC